MKSGYWLRVAVLTLFLCYCRSIAGGMGVLIGIGGIVVGTLFVLDVIVERELKREGRRTHPAAPRGPRPTIRRKQ